MSAARKSVVVTPTGAANLASVRAAFRRLGADTMIAERPEDVEAASHVIAPGVGAFGPAMEHLREHGLDRALIARHERDAPTIAICVGLQLLFEESEESPGARGLAIARGKATHFPRGVRAPQFGWNLIEADEHAPLIDSGFAYFANSFRVTEPPQGWRCAMSDHGGPYLAAIERGNWIGCQFHPELSGAYGAALLSRFLELG